MSLPLFIAFRFLRSKKAHSAVNVISVIATCGMILTAAALVCVLSVFNGFRGLIGDNLAKLDPPIAVTPIAGKTIANGDSVAQALQRLPDVGLALPVVEDQALAAFGERQMPVRLKGVPEGYQGIVDLQGVLTYGRAVLSDAEGVPFAYVGIGPAATMQVRADGLSGERLMLYAPQRVGRVNLANPSDAFTSDSLPVAGVFQTMENTHDGDLVLVPVDVAKELFDYDAEATQIEIKPRDGVSDEQAMRSVATALGKGYAVKNRLMQQAESFRMVNIEKWVTFLLLAFIMLIAAFNVVSALSLLIIEKDSAIATFRSLGATDAQITRVFVAEGWLISLLGAAAGIALGIAVSYGQQHFGWLKLGADPSEVIVTAYPVSVQFVDVAVVFALTALIGLLTAAATTWIVRRKLQAASSVQ